MILTIYTIDFKETFVIELEGDSIDYRDVAKKYDLNDLTRVKWDMSISAPV